MIAAVILAAGASTRMGGRPKQLMRVRGTSLLGHTVACAVRGGCRPVVVVLGADASLMTSEVRGMGVEAVVNAEWTEGMASSIRTGLERVRDSFPEVEAVVLLTCDQALLTPEVVRELRRRVSGDTERIVACEYANTIGVPAAFGRGRFEELAALHGEAGAKPVLLRHASTVVRLPWPEGAVDIDCPDDLFRGS